MPASPDSAPSNLSGIFISLLASDAHAVGLPPSRAIPFHFQPCQLATLALLVPSQSTSPTECPVTARRVRRRAYNLVYGSEGRTRGREFGIPLTDENIRRAVYADCQEHFLRGGSLPIGRPWFSSPAHSVIILFRIPSVN